MDQVLSLKIATPTVICKSPSEKIAGWYMHNIQYSQTEWTLSEQLRSTPAINSILLGPNFDVNLSNISTFGDGVQNPI